MASVGVEIDRRNKAAAFDVVDGEHERTKCDPKTCSGSLDNQEMMVEIADFGRPSKRRMRREPIRPSIRARFGSQCDVIRILEGGQHPRNHDRPHPFRKEAFDAPRCGEGEVESSKGKIDPVSTELDGTAADRQMQHGSSIGGLEIREPRDQPAHGNGRFARENQRVLPRVGSAQILDRRFEFAEKAAKGQIQLFACWSKPQPAPVFCEKSEANIRRQF